MSTPGPPPQLDLDVVDILGPFVISNMLSAVVCGAVITQSASFFHRYSKDSFYHRFTVGVLTANSVAGCIMQMYIMWWITISSRPSVQNLAAVPLVFYGPVLQIIISHSLSQGYFALRAYKLCGRNKYIGGVCFILILTVVALQLAACVNVFTKPRYVFNESIAKTLAPFLPGLEPGFHHTIVFIEASMASSAVTDLIITGAVAWALLGKRSEVNANTENLIVRVVKFSISTAAVTSVYAVVIVIVVITSIDKHNYVYYFAYELPHIQALVCIWSLNLRGSFKSNSSKISTSRSDRVENTLPSTTVHSVEPFQASAISKAAAVEKIVDQGTPDTDETAMTVLRRDSYTTYDQRVSSIPGSN